MRVLFVCLCISLGLPVAGAEIKINFGDYSQGQSLTNDFESARAGGGRPGDWKIVTDEMPSAFKPLLPSTAPTINHISILAQVDTDPTDSRFPMLVYDKETFKDFTMTTRFKILSGVAEQMAGIVFHYQNQSNFYVVRVSALGHNLRFYKYINGQIVDPSLPVVANIASGSWHTMTVQCQGNQINCWLDDKMALPVQSTMTLVSGKVGFWTMSDSLTHFGDSMITYNPEVPMAQLLVQNVMDQEPRILELRIYTLDKSGKPHIIASNAAAEVGKAGTDAEKGAIKDGSIFFGRGRGTVAVTMPLTDRNGDPVAAVRVELKSFLGETRDTALTRARMIVSRMQSQVLSSQDLLQ